MSAKNVQLSEVCEIIAGQSPPSSTYNSDGVGLPFFQGKADFGEIYPTVRYWCSSPNKIAKPDDILLSVRAPVGDTNICNQESCIGRGLAAIRTGKNLDNKFLLHFLRQHAPRLVAKSNGSTFQAITMKDVREIELPLPPLPEQKRIAAILDKAEEIKRKREESLKLADEFLKSIFVDMFGDPVTNPKGWDIGQFSDICDIQGGFAFKSDDYVAQGIRLVKISNVHLDSLTWDDVSMVPSNYAEKYQEFLLNENDILIALTRPIIKSLDTVKMVIVGKSDLPCLLNQRVGRFVIKSKNVFSSFLYHYCKLPEFKNSVERLSSTSLQPNVSPKQLLNLPVYLPPMALQANFDKLIAKFSTMKTTLYSTNTSSNELLGSLTARAFLRD